MNKGYRIFSIILTILTVLATGFFVYQLVKLGVLPTQILLPIIAAIILIVLIMALLVVFMAKIRGIQIHYQYFNGFDLCNHRVWRV